MTSDLFQVPRREESSVIGTVIAGAYRITGVLGVGAMGKVYRAEDVERGTPLAIKVLRSHLGTSKEAAARFRREAFVGVKLVHPNCVMVSDFGTAEDGSFYLAMELLEGESLGDLLDREVRLPWRRALTIARHVLRGLDHAHRESVVHRDIKPDNIIVSQPVDDPDFARILDFGIAKLVGDSAGAAITQAGIAVGTPNYISPEQATGGVVDGRCDLYSLSVVLYEMLTGTAPFADRDAMKAVLAHATEPPPAFAKFAPEVEIPGEVEQLVRDGLAKRPDDRIGSAAEYVVRIDELLRPSDEPVVEAPVAIDAAPPRAPRRRRLVIVAAALAVLAGLAVLAWVQLRDPPAAEAPPSPAVGSARAPQALPADVVTAIKALEDGKTCKARRAAVKRLQALGDPRAIPALEKARSRPRRGTNTNACLVDSIDLAIQALR